MEQKVHKLKSTTWLPVVLMALLAVAGCDYVPRTVYEIETKDGSVLKLLCPTVDHGRSELTYLIGGECIAIK